MMTRVAEKDDLPEVYVMYLAGLVELKEGFNETDALDFMLLCWAKAPCVLLVENDTIIGFAGLTTASPQYDKKRIFLRDYMFYIQPPFRGIRSWRELCNGVQAVSDKFKLPFVGDHRLQGSIKFHERLIRMAGATPRSIISVYGENNGK